MFNARKTHKAYIKFDIFSSYFIVVICKNFRFASLLRFAGTTTNYKRHLQLTLIKRHICTFCLCENLKILIEIFRQNLIVSDFIWLF